MTLKTAFTVVLLLLFNFFRTQKPEFRAPDYASIQKNIEDKKSEFYYPDLLKKLKQNDTLITRNSTVISITDIPFSQIMNRIKSTIILKK
jgi:hypothetical protein